jgi:hypothetical protein
MSRYQKDQGVNGQTSKVTAQQNGQSYQPQKGTQQQQGKQPAQGQGNTKTAANSSQRTNKDPAGGKQAGKSQPQGSQKSLSKNQQTGTNDEKDEYTPRSARDEAAMDPQTEKEQEESLKVLLYVITALTRLYSTLFIFMFC